MASRDEIAYQTIYYMTTSGLQSYRSPHNRTSSLAPGAINYVTGTVVPWRWLGHECDDRFEARISALLERQALEVDYDAEIDDSAPTIEEMWAKMEALGIQRD